MLKGKDIICISSIDWDFIWQGHQEIMSALARQGNRVLFVENTGVRAPHIRDLPRLLNRLKNWWRSTKGIRQEADNLYVYSPLVLPFPYSRVARRINRWIMGRVVWRWMRTMHFSSPVLWTFLPTGLSLDLINIIGPELVIYYCIDHFEVSSPRASKITSYEEKLLKKADLVFVTSHKLKEHCERHNPRVALFPFGVSLGKFERVREEATIEPVDMKAISWPRVGYVGGLHRWVDQELLATVARAHPEHAFVFVGPEQTAVDSLKALDNTHFLGPKPHDEVPLYVKYFDVALIPYRQAAYTDNVYPTKLNEYLAMGVPVVATPIPEMTIFGEANPGCVYLAQGPEAFGKALEAALFSRGGASDAHRRAVSAQNSWEGRIEAMSEMVNEALAAVALTSQAGWQKRFTAIFRQGKTRLMGAALSLASLWFILFHTPALWWVAAPLKLVQPPERADAIVVLGGGVGETGRFGDSTFERTRHGVELFKAGYAPYIIFSTGYIYGYKEAEDMKLLATSLGVPSEAILLEGRSVNTYDKARYVAPILKARGWKKVLLVTAPYHMLRSALTFHGYDSKLELVYAPVPDPTFYRHKRGAKPKHIRAIAHEYAAILYYWFKGYL